MIWHVLQIVYVGCMVLQVLLALVAMPLILPRKWGLYGFEKRLEDGEDIAVLMLCTFCLPLAPVCVVVLVIVLAHAVYEYRRLRTVPADVITALQHLYGGDARAIDLGARQWLADAKG